MSVESARLAFEDALIREEQVGVSPTIHGVTTQQLWQLADQLLTERNARGRLKIEWRTDGSLAFEPLPHA